MEDNNLSNLFYSDTDRAFQRMAVRDKEETDMKRKEAMMRAGLDGRESLLTQEAPLSEEENKSKIDMPDKTTPQPATEEGQQEQVEVTPPTLEAPEPTILENLQTRIRGVKETMEEFSATLITSFGKTGEDIVNATADVVNFVVGQDSSLRMDKVDFTPEYIAPQTETGEAASEVLSFILKGVFAAKTAGVLGITGATAPALRSLGVSKWFAKAASTVPSALVLGFLQEPDKEKAVNAIKADFPDVSEAVENFLEDEITDTALIEERIRNSISMSLFSAGVSTGISGISAGISAGFKFGGYLIPQLTNGLVQIIKLAKLDRMAKKGVGVTTKAAKAGMDKLNNLLVGEGTPIGKTVKEALRTGNMEGLDAVTQKAAQQARAFLKTAEDSITTFGKGAGLGIQPAAKVQEAYNLSNFGASKHFTDRVVSAYFKMKPTEATSTMVKNVLKQTYGDVGKIKGVNEAALKIADRAVNSAIVRDLSLKSSEYIGGAISGSAVIYAADIDINGDGEVDLMDMFYGAILGTAGVKAIKMGKDFFSNSYKALELSYAKERKIVLERVNNKIAEYLKTMNTTEELAKKTAEFADTPLYKYVQLRDSLLKNKTVAGLQKAMLNNPNYLKKLQNLGKPILSSKDSAGLTKAILEGKDMSKYAARFNSSLLNVADELDVENLVKVMESQISKNIPKGISRTSTMNKILTDLDSVTPTLLNKHISYMKGITDNNELSSKVATMQVIDKTLTMQLKTVADTITKMFDDKGNLLKSVTPEAYQKAALEFSKVKTATQTYQAYYAGFKSELGRGLNMLQLMGKKVGGLDLEALTGGQGTVAGQAKLLSEVMAKGNPDEVVAALGMGDYFVDAFRQWRYGALLSRPSTWFNNVLTSSIEQGRKYGEKKIAKLISKAGSKLGREKGLFSRESFQQMEFEEQMMYEAFNSNIFKSFKALGEFIKTGGEAGGGSQYTGKISNTAFKDLAEKYVVGKSLKGTEGGKFISKAFEYIDEVSGFSTKAIGVGDALNSTFAFEQSYVELTGRKAFKEAVAMGLKGAELKAKAADLFKYFYDTPTKDVLDGATWLAQKNVFKTPLEGWLANLMKAVNYDSPGAKLAQSIFLPFQKGAINVYLEGGRYLPGIMHLPTFAKEQHMMLAKGLLTKEEFMVRRGMGYLMSIMAATHFFTGKVRGSSGDFFNAQGEPKQSMTIGNYSLDMSRQGAFFLPYFTTISALEAGKNVIFGTTEVDEETGEVVTRDKGTLDKIGMVINELAITPLGQVLSASPLQGIGDFAALIDGLSGEALAETTGKVITTTIPGIIKDMSSTLDPIVRETYTTFDKILSRLPVASKTLKPARDLYGEPVKIGLHTTLSPIPVREVDSDPLKVALDEVGISFQRYNRSLRRVRGVELSPDQHEERAILNGKLVRQERDNILKTLEEIEKEVEDSGASIEVLNTRKAIVLHRYLSLIRTATANEMLRKYPALYKQVGVDSFIRRGGDPSEIEGL